LLILFQRGRASNIKQEQTHKSRDGKNTDIIEGEFHREDKKNNDDL